MAVHLAVAGDVFGGVLFCAVLFSYEMSLMRSGTELCQFLRIFPAYSYTVKRFRVRFIFAYSRLPVYKQRQNQTTALNDYNYCCGSTSNALPLRYC